MVSVPETTCEKYWYSKNGMEFGKVGERRNIGRI
jgi:hypothetical protein